MWFALMLLVALADAPEPSPSPSEVPMDELPLLDDKPALSENATVFFGNKLFQLTYPAARWELESNDDNGHVRLRWPAADAVLEVMIETLAGKPDPLSPAGRTSLGGAVASETGGWQTDDRGKSHYVGTITTIRKNRGIALEVRVPTSHAADVGRAIADLHAVQRSWHWLF